MKPRNIHPSIQDYQKCRVTNPARCQTVLDLGEVQIARAVQLSNGDCGDINVELERTQRNLKYVVVHLNLEQTQIMAL